MKNTITSILFLYGSLLFSQTETPKNLYSNYRFNEVINQLKNDSLLNAEENYYLGKSYYKIGNSNKAATFLTKATELDSSNVVYRNQLAEFQLRRNEFTEAYFNYKYLIKNDPENSFYYKMLGKALSDMTWTSVFRALISRENEGVYPQETNALDSIKKKLNKQQLLLLPEQAFKKAYTLNHEDIESRMLRNEILLKRNLGAADEAIQESIALFPGNKYFLMQGIKVAFRLKDYQDVLKKSDLFYQMHDSNLVVQRIHGMSCYRLKLYTKADSLLTCVLKIDTDSEIVHYYLGLTNSEMGIYKKAAEYIETAIELGTSKKMNLYYPQLGYIYEHTGAHKKAIKNLKLAHSNNQEPILLYHLARNYDKLHKDKATALSYYEQFDSKKDSSNLEQLNYTKDRIRELKALKHFSK